MSNFSAFAGQRYLNLESFRKNGAAVRTPLWFAQDGETIFVYSTADSGKAKRIRRDVAVRIAPCNMRGTVSGDWIAARAAPVTGAEYDRGMMLLDRKYWPWKAVLGLMAWFRPRPRVVIAIRAE
ncbi:MAG: PPOX class F420-dependent oxidoreductase [Acetobacteraceae bacterium]|nr:PPOX class F420-dependent oxidoreductase [Acetobacteraceae bacterium]